MVIITSWQLYILQKSGEHYINLYMAGWGGQQVQETPMAGWEGRVQEGPLYGGVSKPHYKGVTLTGV